MSKVETRPIVDRQEWLAWRREDLTASDIGAVVGVDPYRTPFAVYADKVSGLGTIETNIMRRGRWLEAATMEALKEELPGYRFMRPNVYLRDPELRLGATPDVVAEDVDDPTTLINIQLKAVSRPRFEEEWADERVPLRYELQTLTEGMLMGANLNLIAALVIDTYSADLVIRDVPRHAAAEERIRQVARHFWDNIANERRPAPDYARDGDTIALFHGHPEAGKTIDLSQDNRMPELLSARAMLKAEQKGIEAHVDAIDAELKDKLGDAEIALLPGWKVTWKEESRKAYTVPAGTRRPLRVFPVKEEAA